MQKTIEGLTYDFEGDVFIDVGGNIGMWAIELLDVFEKIIFIEPSEQAMSQAKARIKNVCKRKELDFSKVSFKKNLCFNASDQQYNIYTPTNDTGNFSIFGQDLYGEIFGIRMKEETHRLTQNLQYFLEALSENKTSGKKLGFIAQEISREINTLGSKCQDARIPKIS